MKKLSGNFYAKLFFTGALWNFSFSVPGLLFPEFTLELGFGPAIAPYIMNNDFALSLYRFWHGAILIFGIGYYIVSRDITKNRGIVWMAIYGKLTFFFFLSYYYFTERAAILSFFGGCGDFIFTLLFALFLWQTKD